MDIPLDLKLFMNNTTQKVYKCDQCNASYSDKSYFDLHKQTHQKGGGENGGEAEAETEELPATVQIVMPAPAHQHDAQVLQEQQQLTAFKRAYGGELHQIYEIAPSTRYQVVTSGTPHVLTAVTLASLPVQVSGTVSGQVTSLPSYTTPTYVLTEQPAAPQQATVTAPRTATLHQDVTQQHQQQQQQQQ